MPYTTPLASIPNLPPRPPSPQGALVGSDGKPTREFFTFINDVSEWMNTTYTWVAAAHEALEEVEP